MYTLIYFSPTGNSKYLAKELSNLLDVSSDNVLELETVNVEELESNEHLILMYPIHGFNAPRAVHRFLKNLPEGLYQKVSLLAVGCNDLWSNDAVSNSIKKILKRKNYTIYVDEILVMPLTIVLKMKDDVLTEIVQKAKSHLTEIASYIKNEEVSNRKVKCKSKVIHTIGKLESPAARLFGLELHAKKGCTSCGICWNRCPEGNIKEGKKGTPKFGFKCSMCMRCIYDCPVKVITPYMSKFLTVKGGYNINETTKKLQ